MVLPLLQEVRLKYVQDSLQNYVIPETGNPFDDIVADEDEDRLDNNEAVIDEREIDEFNSDE